MTAKTSPTPGRVSIDDKPRLSPAEAAIYLEREHGLRLALQTLAHLRRKGGGPAFCRPLAKAILYDKADLDAWAAEKVARRVRTTAELGTKAPAAAGA
jgi:hypothetical protein